MSSGEADAYYNRNRWLVTAPKLDEFRGYFTAEDLSAAMSEAFEYTDDPANGGVPVLPWYDDFEAFWDPFAKKVVAILNAEHK